MLASSLKWKNARTSCFVDAALQLKLCDAPGQWRMVYIFGGAQTPLGFYLQTEPPSLSWLPWYPAASVFQIFSLLITWETQMSQKWASLGHSALHPEHNVLNKPIRASGCNRVLVKCWPSRRPAEHCTHIEWFIFKYITFFNFKMLCFESISYWSKLWRGGAPAPLMDGPPLLLDLRPTNHLIVKEY